MERAVVGDAGPRRRPPAGLRDDGTVGEEAAVTERGGRGGSVRVACYLLLLAAGAALLWHQAAGLPPYRAAGLLSWPVVAAASAAAELFVLHIQVRREAQAVSLSQIPTMLGL